MDELLTYLIGAAAVVALILFAPADRRTTRRHQAQLKEAEEHRLSEENIAKVQTRFENNLRKGVAIRLPDAVLGRELYIYQNLMRGWFAKLVARNRFDDAMDARKLRQDWLAYMDLVEGRETARFWAFEDKHEAKRERHRQVVRQQVVQLEAIEDGFAEAVGPDAVETLRQIRIKEADAFSFAGQLAPDGYMYHGYSPRGVPEEPIPRKTAK